MSRRTKTLTLIALALLRQRIVKGNEKIELRRQNERVTMIRQRTH